MPSRCLDPNEREQPRRAPEPSLAPPTSASAILALQRSAGNHAVARTLQRLTKVGADSTGVEYVQLEPGEPLPEADGYEYEPLPDIPGRYARRRRGHQQPGSGKLIDQQAYHHYGTFKQQDSGGATVVPNLSQYFKVAAIVDLATYGNITEGLLNIGEYIEKGGYKGHGRLIDGSDLDTFSNTLQTSAEQKAGEAGERIKSITDKFLLGIAEPFKAKGGKPVEADDLVQRLRPVLVNPAVTHYLQLHRAVKAGVGGTGAALGAGTKGASSVVQKIVDLFGGVTLSDELYNLVEAMRSGRKGSHQEDAYPLTLAQAIKHLADHFAAHTGFSVTSLLPEEAGTALGAAQLGSGTAGLNKEAEAACATIRRHHIEGNPFATKVVNLLGVPHGLVQATGGEKALQIRL